MGYRYGGIRRKITDTLARVRVKPKTLLLVVAVVAALYLTYSIAGTVTGYIADAQARSTEKKLNETRQELSHARDATEQCETSLQKTEQTLQLCAAERDDAQQETAQCLSHVSSQEAALSACNQTAQRLEEELQTLQQGYASLSVNSAQRVCCRPGIEISEWGVVSGNVTCAGTNKINCTSGEVNVTI